MTAYLTISQAAIRLGVSTDTVRAWVQQGKLHAEHTLGGHRRFLLSDIERLAPPRAAERPAGMPESSQPLAGAKAKVAVPAPRRDAASLWPSIAQDARARLEAVKARTQAREILLGRELHEAKIRDEAAKSANEANEARRLQALKTLGQGEAQSAGLPPEWRARVTADLESYVSAVQFPPTLPKFEAREFIRARVHEFEQRYREELAERSERERAAQAAALARSRVNDLIGFGVNVAAQSTMFWDPSDRTRALAEIRRELKADVEPDWTFEEVRIRVEDLLDDSEDDFEDGEDEAAEKDFDET